MTTKTHLTGEGPVHHESEAWLGRGSAHRARMGRFGAVGAAIALAAGAAACGSAAGASTSQAGCGSGGPRITVVANGQASATPDTLTITIGVTVSDPTASAALSDANQQAATLANSLKSSGVTPADIQSTDFSINPTTNLSGAITGYQVSNTLLVTLHQLAGAGQAIDAAAASVGNAIRVNGLTFSVSDTGNVDGRARADAVETAAAHARAMTAAAGESLGRICSISDSTTSPAPYLATGAPNAPSSAQAVPLEAGTQQANAQVTVVYSITGR